MENNHQESPLKIPEHRGVHLLHTRSERFWGAVGAMLHVLMYMIPVFILDCGMLYYRFYVFPYVGSPQSAIHIGLLFGSIVFLGHGPGFLACVQIPRIVHEYRTTNVVDDDQRYKLWFGCQQAVSFVAIASIAFIILCWFIGTFLL